MPRDGVTVIDGDGHVLEPQDLWTDRMDHVKWGDWIPRTDPATGKRYVGGEVRSGATDALKRAPELSGLPVERVAHDAAVATERLGRAGGCEPKARLEDMDKAGIEASVLYPSNAMFFAPSDPIPALRNVEFVRDCQRAYNEWLAEFCSEAPSRLFGAGLVPLQDAVLAVAETKGLIELGLKGVIVRPSAYVDDLPLSHNVYDPFWEACQELSIPVTFHPAVHADTPGAWRKFGLVVDDPDITVVNNTVSAVCGGSGFGQAIGNAVDMILTVGRLIMGGVCERFPGLKCIFLESGGGWMPTILERMDQQVEEFPLQGEHLSMKPSDYFRRQCYVSFGAQEWNLAASAKWLGADRIIWASDYPHYGYSDRVLDDLSRSLAPLDVDGRRRIYCFNQIEAYSLPLGAAA